VEFFYSLLYYEQSLIFLIQDVKD